MPQRAVASQLKSFFLPTLWIQTADSIHRLCVQAKGRTAWRAKPEVVHCRAVLLSSFWCCWEWSRSWWNSGWYCFLSPSGEWISKTKALAPNLTTRKLLYGAINFVWRCFYICMTSFLSEDFGFCWASFWTGNITIAYDSKEPTSTSLFYSGRRLIQSQHPLKTASKRIISFLRKCVTGHWTPNYNSCLWFGKKLFTESDWYMDTVSDNKFFTKQSL